MCEFQWNLYLRASFIDFCKLKMHELGMGYPLSGKPWPAGGLSPAVAQEQAAAISWSPDEYVVVGGTDFDHTKKDTIDSVYEAWQASGSDDRLQCGWIYMTSASLSPGVSRATDTVYMPRSCTSGRMWCQSVKLANPPPPPPGSAPFSGATAATRPAAPACPESRYRKAERCGEVALEECEEHAVDIEGSMYTWPCRVRSGMCLPALEPEPLC